MFTPTYPATVEKAKINGRNVYVVDYFIRTFADRKANVAGEASSLVFKSANNADAYKTKSDRNAAEGDAYFLEVRAIRAENVRAYLAARAARGEAQFSFAF